MRSSAISQRFDTIVEFIAFENLASYERKGKNKIKRVENHKIKVAIEDIGGTMPEELSRQEKSIKQIEKEQLKRLNDQKIN